MELNKKIIKALASDTKVDILKTLTHRNKTTAELSRELNLAPSTMIEHMKDLEKLSLIKRIETGHKWIYYELTQSGKNIIRPTFPMQIVITLCLGFVMITAGFFGMFSTQINTFAAVERSAESAQAIEAETGIAEPATGFIVFMLIFVIGILCIIYGAWRIKKSK